MNHDAAAPLQGITEHDIAEFLANNPGFFERHAQLLGSIQLTSPYGKRAVSLQERQLELLRERIKGLELKIVEMIRHGQENMAIADRLHRWTRAMLLTADETALPGVLVARLKHEFLIPQAAIRLWGLAPAHQDADFTQGVDEATRRFTEGLALPLCGASAAHEAVAWLEDASAVASVAMVPLRDGAGPEGCFGLLVVGSPDPTRYGADMGTEFLMRIGEIASAGLARLRPRSRGERL